MIAGTFVAYGQRMYRWLRKVEDNFHKDSSGVCAACFYWSKSDGEWSRNGETSPPPPTFPYRIALPLLTPAGTVRLHSGLHENPPDHALRHPVAGGHIRRPPDCVHDRVPKRVFWSGLLLGSGTDSTAALARDHSTSEEESQRVSVLFSFCCFTAWPPFVCLFCLTRCRKTGSLHRSGSLGSMSSGPPSPRQGDRAGIALHSLPLVKRGLNTHAWQLQRQARLAAASGQPRIRTRCTEGTPNSVLRIGETLSSRRNRQSQNPRKQVTKTGTDCLSHVVRQ